MPLTLKYNLETGHPTPLPPAVGSAGVGFQTCFIPVMAKFAGMSWEEIYNTFWSLPVPNHCMNNLSHSELVILWEAVAKINQVSKLKEISFSLLKKSFCWSFIKLVKKKNYMLAWIWEKDLLYLNSFAKKHLNEHVQDVKAGRQHHLCVPKLHTVHSGKGSALLQVLMNAARRKVAFGRVMTELLG